MLKYLTRIGIAASLAIASLGTAGAQSLTPVTLAYSNPAMIQGTNLIYIPLAMKYWEEQGYDVRLVPGRDSTTTVQQLVGGNADVIMLNTSPVIAANIRTNGDVRSLIISSYTAWRLFTLKDGPTDFEQLRGKNIGVPTVSSGGQTYLEDALRKRGIDPEKDVRIVVAGFGAQAMEALKSGRVDAMLTFQIQAAQYQQQGMDLNILYDEDWVQFPDHGLATTKALAEKDPKMVEAIARGFAMAQVFEQANPECSARIYNKLYVRDLTPQIEEMHKFAAKISQEQRERDFATAGGKLWGNIDPAGLDKLQAFLVKNKVLEAPVDSSTLIIDPEMFAKANDFDHEKVKQDAIACKGF